MVAFLKEVYGRAKGAYKFLMSQQPALKYSRNAMVVSSFWDMRLSITCPATDAEFQNRITLHENIHVVRHTRRRASSPLPEGA
jgi:hypothetical protein